MRHLVGSAFVIALMLTTAPAFGAPNSPRPSKAPATRSSERQMPLITTQQLKAKLDKHESLTLVEALEPEYYAQGHLPGAIQLIDAAKFAKKLLPNKRAEIVVYCMNTH